MKQLMVKKGRVYAEAVPAPMVEERNVLVAVRYSCISAGTEMTSVASTGESLMHRAVKHPRKIMEVMDRVKREGLAATIQKVQARLEAGSPLGYSASGVVIDVGMQVKDVRIGDRVACSGSGIANHAEYIEVPRNLLVRVPDEVDFDLSSTVTLGAIAMQGVRRADVKLGEYVAVLGLGILGQITAQLLNANGCRVIGIDLNDRRIRKAVECGLEKGLNPGNEDVVRSVTAYSGGRGVDAVVITTATDSKEPLAQAFQMCRRKGRVVLVGVVGMEINRDDMYKKELDFVISTSYGPGRYDDAYEQKGIDYPYGYVRWTENRNMEEYLRLVARGKISVEKLVERVYTVDEASKAYEELKDSADKPLIVLLKYAQEENGHAMRNVPVRSAARKKDGRIAIALAGAGNFAKATHLPNIARLRDTYTLYAVSSKTGSNAAMTANQFGARYATTDYRDVLADENVDVVLIATRHNLHARMAIEALKAGKAVFLEKPMAVNRHELEALAKAVDETKNPFMVGFNRRFSKYAREIKRLVSHRGNPMIVQYQMNAGHIPGEHWVHEEEGGGRIIGEACHIFDLFNYFTEAEVESISVDKITPKTQHYLARDNVVSTIKYAEGTICTLTYTSLGNKEYPKESCQVYFDGKIVLLDDYKKLTGYGMQAPDIHSVDPDKGQYDELVEFARYVKGEIPQPVPLWQCVQATEMSFQVEESSC